MVTLDLTVLAAYLVGILLVGIWAQRKAKTQEDFLVAGRSVGPILYSGTLAAVILWRRGTPRAALVSIAVSSAAVVILLVVKGIDSDAPIYWGLGLSLAIYLGLSIGTRATAK